MTVRTAREQLSRIIEYLHLDENSFSIRNRHLVSKNGIMNIPVSKILVIIPAHGTVMAIMPRED